MKFDASTYKDLNDSDQELLTKKKGIKKKNCPECNGSMEYKGMRHNGHNIFFCGRVHRPLENYDLDVEVETNQKS